MISNFGARITVKVQFNIIELFALCIYVDVKKCKDVA